MASTGETWRLGRRPALDGLRGVAILLVLVEHLNMPVLPWAGAVGVTVFFTLSGFLITALLLEERTRTGGVSFAGFWWRRACRLLPAMFACVLAVAVLGFSTGQRWFVDGRHVAAALTYTMDFVNANSWPRPTTALSHTWSLAVEEQFYLTWPLLLVVLLRRTRPSSALFIAAVGSLVPLGLRVMFWDGGRGINHVMYGGDTRADALLVGCALAIVMHRRREGQSRPALVAASLLLPLAVAYLPRFDALVLGPTLVAAATAVTIFAVAQGSGAGILSTRPLVWLGRRSYGLYLWHVPIVAVVASVFDAAWIPTTLIALPLSLVVTVLSWRFIEQPVLRQKHRIGQRVQTPRTDHAQVSTPLGVTQ